MADQVEALKEARVAAEAKEMAEDGQVQTKVSLQEVVAVMHHVNKI